MTISLTDPSRRSRPGQPSARELQDLRERMRQVPATFPVAPAAAPRMHVQVIGGYTVDGIDLIRYAASLTLTQAWDPDTDTSGYPAGLGRGWLVVNGVLQTSRVLIRHDWSAHPNALISGARLVTLGTVALTYDPGGGGAIVTMQAYTPVWA